MNRTRDSRRQKVYNAEDHLPRNVSRAAQKFLVNGKKVAGTGNVSIEACQEYVDYVVSSVWFQRRWGAHHRIQVRHKTYGQATGGSGRICLPPWSRNEAVILHEMAHCLTPDHRDGTPTAAHGPEFAAVLLTLVQNQMGVEAGKTLRAAYSKERVKYRDGLALVPKPSPNRRVITRTERAAAKRAILQREKSAEQAEREAARKRLTGYSSRIQSATALRALVQDGYFGPAGSAPRRAALATARELERGGRR